MDVSTLLKTTNRILSIRTNGETLYMNLRISKTNSGIEEAPTRRMIFERKAAATSKILGPNKFLKEIIDTCFPTANQGFKSTHIRSLAFDLLDTKFRSEK